MAPDHTPLTAERLRELLYYYPETGEFRWLVAGKGRRAAVGSRIGRYAYITIDYKRYALHRLAWLYMTGEWPKNEIDHVNRKPRDNRFDNLRDVPRLTNARNNGFRRHGVSIHKGSKLWRVRVYGKHLGYFHNRDAAILIAKLHYIDGLIQNAR